MSVPTKFVLASEKVLIYYHDFFDTALQIKSKVTTCKVWGHLLTVFPAVFVIDSKKLSSSVPPRRTPTGFGGGFDSAVILAS